MKVVVVGAGHVGLVAAACLAELGHEVSCVDVDEARVESVNAGKAPIHEPGLAELLLRHCGRRLSATADLAGPVGDADLSMIAVGAPFDGRALDLTAVRAAAGGIGKAIRDRRDYHVVVVKSTVVPGTTEGVVAPLIEEASGKSAGAEFGVAMNPEFLTEGRAVEDFMHPDRLVLGGADERSTERLDELYAGFPGVPRLRTSPKTAELIKYASNALLATMISFANEIANVCSAEGGVDVVDVMRGLHTARYLTPLADRPGPARAPITSFLEAGCGFGGSCLPKDVRALIAHGEGRGVSMPVLRAVIEVNERRADELVARLRRHVPDLSHARVSVLGLAFKPDTDDVRVSPAIPVIERLLEAGARVKAHDPLAALPGIFESRVGVCRTLEEAVEEVDAIVLVTRWEAYRALPNVLASSTSAPVLIDGRRMLDRASVPRYDGIGL